MQARRFLAAWTIFVLAFLYLPLVPLVVWSFNDSRLNIVWRGFTFRWYRELWNDRPLMQAAGNSLVIALAVTGISVVIGTLGAWGLYRYRLPFARTMATLIAIPLIVPEVILGISLLVFFAAVHFELGLTSIIIGHVTFCFPFVLIAVHARLAGMDPALEEAAMDLGATPARALVQVIVPYLMPAIVSGALMAFVLSMDELIVTYFICGPGSPTLPVKVFGMARVGLSPVLNAVSTLFVVGTAIVVMIGAYVRRRAA